MMMRVVLNINGRKVRILALRDTGAPDTVISKGYLDLLAPGLQLKPTNKKFIGMGGSAY